MKSSFGQAIDLLATMNYEKTKLRKKNKILVKSTNDMKISSLFCYAWQIAIKGLQVANILLFRGYEEETKSLVGNSSNGTAGHQRRDSFVSQVPSWIEVQELHWKERAEIQLYKLVSLIPVSVTFCLYTYLFVYYSYVRILTFDRALNLCAVLPLPDNHRKLFKDLLWQSVGEWWDHNWGHEEQISMVRWLFRIFLIQPAGCYRENYRD